MDYRSSPDGDVMHIYSGFGWDVGALVWIVLFATPKEGGMKTRQATPIPLKIKIARCPCSRCGKDDSKLIYSPSSVPASWILECKQCNQEVVHAIPEDQAVDYCLVSMGKPDGYIHAMQLGMTKVTEKWNGQFNVERLPQC